MKYVRFILKCAIHCDKTCRALAIYVAGWMVLLAVVGEMSIFGAITGTVSILCLIVAGGTAWETDRTYESIQAGVEDAKRLNAEIREHAAEMKSEIVAIDDNEWIQWWREHVHD